MNYYSYKLYAIFYIENVFQNIALSPASLQDINYLKDSKNQISDCNLIGNRG
mgnify:CR=1 FL=1